MELHIKYIMEKIYNLPLAICWGYIDNKITSVSCTILSYIDFPPNLCLLEPMNVSYLEARFSHIVIKMKSYGIRVFYIQHE